MIPCLRIRGINVATSKSSRRTLSNLCLVGKPAESGTDRIKGAKSFFIVVWWSREQYSQGDVWTMSYMPLPYYFWEDIQVDKDDRL